MDDKTVVLQSIVDMIDDATGKGKKVPADKLLSSIKNAVAHVLAEESTLNGKININRVSGTNGNYIVIELIDAKSGVQFCSVKMGFSELGSAITGQSHMPCSFELRSVDLVGKTHEHKEVLVPFDCYDQRRKNQAVTEAALSPWEVNGWKGRVDDLFNGHRSGKDAQGEKCQRVIFERFV